ncbi:MAG: hypothetical protein EOP06_10110 [Proteobacteria bacterium]|nr:MAG: hypothetical protein EOP06_10110 [Pseudomonadota bacterium]
MVISAFFEVRFLPVNLTLLSSRNLSVFASPSIAAVAYATIIPSVVQVNGYDPADPATEPGPEEQKEAAE